MFLMNNRSECESLLFRMPPLSGVIDGVTYENNIFMTVGANGQILTSPDGTTWTSRTSGTSTDLSGITFANDHPPYSNSSFVVVGLGGTILTSLAQSYVVERTSGTTKNLQGVAYKE